MRWRRGGAGDVQCPVNEGGIQCQMQQICMFSLSGASGWQEGAPARSSLRSWKPGERSDKRRGSWKAGRRVPLTLTHRQHTAQGPPALFLHT
jgi:hypothetical protein